VNAVVLRLFGESSPATERMTMWIAAVLITLITVTIFGLLVTKKISVSGTIERGDYDVACANCNGRARPMRRTHNKYSCPICGREFVGPKHDH
jgi:predicted RNA-binding Zn-ribbon protein involved in translation (DUF1610 family)